MRSVKDEISSIEKEITEKQHSLKQLKSMLESYPDLEVHTGRWNKKVYSSRSVNSLVNNYDTRHNCGCCSDSPLEVWPYLETEYGKIYSSPAMFFVGQKNEYRYGDLSDPGWEDKLRKENIPEELIERMSSLFSDEDYEEDDEEYNVDDD